MTHTRVMKNCIKKFREKIGLSQRALAKAAGTNQSQLQRIEAGVQEVRIDTALRICAALKEPLHLVFPETKKIIAKANQKQATPEAIVDKLTREPEYAEALGKAGIEVDINVWSVHYRLRGGYEGEWPVSAVTQKRLWHAFQSDHAYGFVCFDSGSKRILVNPKHLLSWHFVRAFGGPEPDTEEGCHLRIFFAEGGKPWDFSVYVDAEHFDFKNPVDDEHDIQLQLMVDLVETGGADEEICPVASFRDMDGDRVFFRPPNVSLIELSLAAVKPGLDDDDDEDTIDLDSAEDEEEDDDDKEVDRRCGVACACWRGWILMRVLTTG